THHRQRAAERARENATCVPGYHSAPERDEERARDQHPSPALGETGAGTAEIRAREVRAREVGTTQIGPAQIRAAQPRAGQRSLAQWRGAQITALDVVAHARTRRQGARLGGGMERAVPRATAPLGRRLQ